MKDLTLVSPENGTSTPSDWVVSHCAARAFLREGEHGEQL
jgi:hypothetical protein